MTLISEGVTNVRNALISYHPDLRERIEVVAYCPSAYIDPELCFSIAHYCSRNDYVHEWVDEGFYEGKPNVTYLSRDPKASRWFDHSAKSPTFTRVLDVKINDYLRN